MRKVPFSLYLDGAQHAALKELSRRSRVKMSVMVAWFIDRMLARVAEGEEGYSAAELPQPNRALLAAWSEAE